MLTILPPELLHEIMSFLDNDGLLQLGLTCRSTHVIALSTFFKRNDIREPGDGWLVAYKTPPETLAAIHAAEWINNLRQIHYYLNPDVERLLAEVCELNHLVQSLRKVEMVKLHFSVVDSWASGPQDHVLDRMEWLKEFTSLLDSIIDQDCKELYIFGGGAVRNLYSEDEPLRLELAASDPTASLSNPHIPAGSNDASSNHSNRDNATPTQQLGAVEDDQQLSTTDQCPPPVDLPLNEGRKSTNIWRMITSPLAWIYKIFRLLFGAVNPPSIPSVLPTPQARNSSSDFSVCDSVITPPDAPKRQEGLRELHLHSDMLLQSTFYLWTVRTLTRVAPTLTCLSFKWVDIPAATCMTLFASFTLPHLESFNITTDLVVCKDSANFTDLVNFFRRHGTIQRIILQGVERPFDLPVIDEPILPHLVHIMAHPIWISSLLTMVETFPDALPNLSEIGISTEYYQQGRFDYDFVDDSLERLANFPRTGTTLTLRFMWQSGVAEWFARHVTLGKQNSYISRLTCVSSLVISTSFFVNFQPQTIREFPQWLALFPCLVSVKFVEMPEEQYGHFNNQGFLKALVELCPDIKSLEVGRTTCNLQFAKGINDNSIGGSGAVDKGDLTYEPRTGARLWTFA